MRAYELNGAALAIDNHIIGNSNNDFSKVYELSDYLQSLASPGESRKYDELSMQIPIFLKPVEDYSLKIFEPGAQVRDLAEKLIIISHDLRCLVQHDDERKKRLRTFCLELSKAMMDNEYTQIHRHYIL